MRVLWRRFNHGFPLHTSTLSLVLPPPHLHVQLFTDLLGLATELDGVARASERDVWMSISPNPAALLVGVDRQTTEANNSPPNEMA